MLRRRLAEARDEYAARAREGRGGLDVLVRYADRMDGLVREIAEAAGAQTTMPIAVCALGGYGRRTLCLHSDIDLLIVTEGPIGSARGARHLVAPAAALGSSADGRAARSRARRLRPASSRTTRSCCSRCSTSGSWPATGGCTTASRGAWRRRRPNARRVVVPRAPRAAGGSTRTVQPDDLPARTGREGGARRTSRHRGDPDPPAAAPRSRHRSAVGRASSASVTPRSFLFRAPLAAARRRPGATRTS